jgi:hypothetical protein
LDNALIEARIRKANEAKGIQVGDVAHGMAEVMHWLAGGFVNFCGAMVGLAGLFQRERKKSLAAWGFGLNVMLPLANIIFLFALG